METTDALRSLRTVDITPEDWQAGRAWYNTARREARRMARDHGLTLGMAAGIIAAWSPRMHWSVNLRKARETAAGLDATGLGTSKRAAERIRGGERPLDVLKGRKVRAFYRNIMGHEHDVTVDVWAARAAGWPSDAVPAPAYRIIGDAYRALAAEYGATPAQTQAAVWVAVRGRAA